MKNLGHLMLDLETMGNKSNSTIVSIGAVEFDIETGETGREFYMRVDLQSCLDVGLIINASTVYWWMQRSEEARTELCKGGDKIQIVLAKLAVFITELGDGIQVWGNGVRFDIGILEDAYVACNYQEMPWSFRYERDVRTLVSFKAKVKEEYVFKGTMHNPIDDCKFQIEYCTAIWNSLNHD